MGSKIEKKLDFDNGRVAMPFLEYLITDFFYVKKTKTFIVFNTL